MFQKRTTKRGPRSTPLSQLRRYTNPHVAAALAYACTEGNRTTILVDAVEQHGHVLDGPLEAAGRGLPRGPHRRLCKGGRKLRPAGSASDVRGFGGRGGALHEVRQSPGPPPPALAPLSCGASWPVGSLPCTAPQVLSVSYGVPLLSGVPRKWMQHMCLVLSGSSKAASVVVSKHRVHGFALLLSGRCTVSKLF